MKHNLLVHNDNISNRGCGEQLSRCHNSLFLHESASMLCLVCTSVFLHSILVFSNLSLIKNNVTFMHEIHFHLKLYFGYLKSI